MPYITLEEERVRRTKKVAVRDEDSVSLSRLGIFLRLKNVECGIFKVLHREMFCISHTESLNDRLDKRTSVSWNEILKRSIFFLREA